MSFQGDVSTRIHISKSADSITENEDGYGYIGSPRINRQRTYSGRIERRIPLEQKIDLNIRDKVETDFRKYALYVFTMKLIGERIYQKVKAFT